MPCLRALTHDAAEDHVGMCARAEVSQDVQVVRHSAEGRLASLLEALGVCLTRGLHPDCITKPPAAFGVSSHSSSVYPSPSFDRAHRCKAS